MGDRQDKSDDESDGRWTSISTADTRYRTFPRAEEIRKQDRIEKPIGQKNVENPNEL